MSISSDVTTETSRETKSEPVSPIDHRPSDQLSQSDLQHHPSDNHRASDQSDRTRPSRESEHIEAAKEESEDEPEAEISSRTPGGTRTARRKKKHKKINKDHPEFELTYDMMLGIRTTVSQVESKPFRRLTLSDFNETTKWRFDSEGSSTTPAHQMRDFKFKDYSPEVFRHVRDRFGVKADDYLLCVCGNFRYLEFISNSKSGQFFFYTHDHKYLIKTITQAESKYLRQILPHYYHYVMNNPDTFITRFFGLHRVKPHKKAEVHFLILGSVFSTDKLVHSTFDLKGSRQGRSATEQEKKQGGVLKDNDFVNLGFKIKLGPELKKTFLTQLGKDVDFLKQLNVMDYSLLLGVHQSDAKINEARLSAKLDAIKLDSLPPTGTEHKEAEAAPNAHDHDHAHPHPHAQAHAHAHDAHTAGAEHAEEKHEHHDAEDADDPADKLPIERRQTNYGVPADYDKVSSPLHHNFDAPAFQPIPEHHAKLERPRSANGLAKSIFNSENGGVRSVDGDGKPGKEIYFMGIIDILTLYGVKKKIEHMGKSIKYSSKVISAVNPTVYAARFMEFIEAGTE